MKSKKNLFLVIVSLSTLFIASCNKEISDASENRTDISEISETPNITETPVITTDPVTTEDNKVSEDDGKVDVVTDINAEDLPLTTYTEDTRINSIVTMTKSVIVDSSSAVKVENGTDLIAESVTHRIKIGNSESRAIKLDNITIGTKIQVWAKSASSSRLDEGMMIVKEGETTPVYDSTDYFSASGQPSLEEYTFESEGSFYLYSHNTGFNVYFIRISQRLLLGEENGIALNTSSIKTEYLLGDTFTSAGLSVDKTYTSGAQMFLTSDQYQIDSSGFDSTKPGEYDIKVTYKSYIETFKVRVNDIESIVPYYKHNAITDKKVSRVSAIYLKDSMSDFSKVIIKAKTPDGKELDIPASEVHYSGFSSKEVGEKDVTFSVTRLSKTYQTTIKTYVLLNDITADTDGTYTVVVDKTAVTGSKDTNGHYQFASIQDAHDYLRVAVAKTENKKITIKEGTYNEKVYIEIPNVSLVNEDPTKTVSIDYNAYNELKSASGVSWSTYGSSSVTVREEASNFKAENITFRNTSFMDSNEYNNCPAGSKQACAIVVDADKSVFNNCTFFGLQDTLYARLNNQSYNNCKISGFTDFIFGEEANVKFSGCTVTSLLRKKKDGTLDSNGGYLVATKPTSVDIKMGFWFDNCSFEKEEGVLAESISLARPWGKDSKVIFSNSTMGDHISKQAYNNTSSGSRYVSMSNNSPVNAKYYEYNNSGLGSITTAVAGMSIMTEEEYNAYVALQTA